MGRTRRAVAAVAAASTLAVVAHVTVPSAAATPTDPTSTTTTVAAVPPSKGPVRLAGPDRIATAVAISQSAYQAVPGATPAGGTHPATAAVIADADAFPDALVAAPLAAALGGPILLSHPDALDPLTRSELTRILAPASVVAIVGGPLAVSDAVAGAITALGFSVVRFSGPDRFGTAVAVAHDALHDPGAFLIATGDDFPDGLAAGAAAAAVHAALLLTDGPIVPAATATYLNLHPKNVLVAVGAPAAEAVPIAYPVYGADRFSTAVSVAQVFFQHPTAIGVADGRDFPDALTGGAHAAGAGGPLLLTDPDQLSPPTDAYVRSVAPVLVTGYVYGGTLAVSTAVEAALATDLAG